MQVERIYHITAEAYFLELKRLAINDFEVNTGEVLPSDQSLRGLTYIKKFGKNNANQARVEITKFEPYQVYESVIKSNRGCQVMTYSIEEKDSHTIAVTYNEKLEDIDFFTKINYKLLLPFMKKRLQKGIEKRLDYIATRAIESDDKVMGG
ncbi:DUF3284 domain-containing protein [Aerococcus urinae]|uniref:DUF3284 domain-containing protein n=1 Tax=Aerococcus urinae TaxID=1376 RepID=UPI00254E78C3|nr:DUF3284 domain-containing protein [Aerococcus urinae]MDK6371129.1 DUF3284 domain-containing protein [Aerococcus urinae]